jgi:hypothetical protein
MLLIVRRRVLRGRQNIYRALFLFCHGCQRCECWLDMAWLRGPCVAVHASGSMKHQKFPHQGGNTKSFLTNEETSNQT